MPNEELKWRDVEKTVVRLWNEGALDRGVEELDKYIAMPPREKTFLREALAYRGMLAQEQDDIATALSFLTKAHALSEPNTYSTYALRLSLSKVCEEMGDDRQSLSWIRSALETVLNADGISGGQALVQFLNTKGEENLDENERRLCDQVIRKSWTTLRQSGEPDVVNLTKTAVRLVELGSRSLPSGGAGDPRDRTPER